MYNSINDINKIITNWMNLPQQHAEKRAYRFSVAAGTGNNNLEMHFNTSAIIREKGKSSLISISAQPFILTRPGVFNNAGDFAAGCKKLQQLLEQLENEFIKAVEITVVDNKQKKLQ